MLEQYCTPDQRIEGEGQKVYEDEMRTGPNIIRQILLGLCLLLGEFNVNFNPKINILTNISPFIYSKKSTAF